ncbi:MAG: hypothetical protein WCS70_01855 [Verrucomicrobiota bacterium]
MRVDLTGLPWQLCGWRPYTWLLQQAIETATPFHADITPIPATVPGSAQTALRAAGLLPDWNVGLQSLACEWVEHRHWEFFTDVVLPAGPLTLHAEGLDHAGWILVDGKRVAEFTGALIRHDIPLTGDGQSHRLSILFDEPPAEQGQVGFTSRTQHFKPRYNYSWDWCPRFVPVGISDRLWLEVGAPVCEIIRLRTELAADNQTGHVHLQIHCRAPVTLQIASVTRDLPVGEHRVEFQLPVEPWWPNGAGPQRLYDLRIGDQTIPVGFKRVTWNNWVCEVNGRPLFLQGVNWTPIRVDYHSVTAADYARLIEMYRAMGCNLLRVWGGAFLEREEFYRCCDAAGLLVWQEFPLSSSGPDNNAPNDPAIVEKLCGIARDYIHRRGHHVSKLLWCGGNELQTAPGKSDGCGRPLDLTHPCLAALAEVVATEDPGVRFLPTSASGPRFTAAAKDFGKGLHHDVHGPWNWMPEWDDYWANDDALFRSETGVPGAMAAELIEKYRGECAALPASHANPWWQHTSAWWIQDDLAAGKSLAEYVEASQALQARAVAKAAQACRDRFPRCGGFLLWMGHDCFPCPVNTAVIDFSGRPKPAYYTLQKIFTQF